MAPGHRLALQDVVVLVVSGFVGGTIPSVKKEGGHFVSRVCDWLIVIKILQKGSWNILVSSV